MDSLRAEQERLITMKSSSISLLTTLQGHTKPHLINLIDSPGHVDFASEVSSALRLSDGAIVVIDAVEGVCIQTRAVLHQAWKESVRPCLVINKIDKLVTGLGCSPAEAYLRLKRVLEQANVVMAQMWNESVVARDMGSSAPTSAHGESVDNTSSEATAQAVEDLDDSDVYFSPEGGNVVFASAMDGWGFRLSDFAAVYASKLGVRPELLQKTLWGEYYFRARERRIVPTRLAKGNDEPMFVKFVLENIWAVYDAVLQNRNPEKIEKIVARLSLSVSPRELKTRDSRGLLQAIMTRWLPLSDTVLPMVVEVVPAPPEAQRTRFPRIWKGLIDGVGRGVTADLMESVLSCNTDPDGPCVVFVSKVFPAPMSAAAMAAMSGGEESGVSADPVALARARVEQFDRARAIQRRLEMLDAGGHTKKVVSSEVANEGESGHRDARSESEHFIGFARVFSGVLRCGQSLHVLGPRYNPQFPDEYRSELVISELFMMMGRVMEPVTEAPAGSVIGIGGDISDHVLKTATLCSTVECPTFPLMDSTGRPVIRVAVEPVNAVDTPQLVHGLRLLMHSDPGVETLAEESGEHVIMVAGEVHLERCLDDLRDRFARIPIIVSPPIVSFRETIASKGDGAETVSANDLVRLCVRAVPLPEDITRILEDNSELIRESLFSVHSSEGSRANGERKGTIDLALRAMEFWQTLQETCVSAGSEWLQRLNQLWSLGPRRVGACWLVNDVPSLRGSRRWTPVEVILKGQRVNDGKSKGDVRSDRSSMMTETEVQSSQSDSGDRNLLRGSLLQMVLERLENAIITGFQLAALAGPLCGEPVAGVCFLVEDISLQFPANWDDEPCVEEQGMTYSTISDTYGPLSGQVISAMKDCCRQAFENAPMRLREATYLCDVQSAGNVLGKIYGVLSKRRGRVIEEEVKEGTDIFDLQAVLPVVESFGFAEELRTRTSGAAHPQLIPSHWEMLNQNPYYRPSTQDEVEEWGQWDLRRNVARDYMNAVRKRKGLATEEKIVEHAEKQRTLTKMV